MRSQRRRVLVLAESANPEWVSVPLLGWSLVRALREVADVHLVTQVRNLPAIQRSGLLRPDEYTTIDSEAFAKPLHHLSTMLRGGKDGAWTTNTAIEALAYPYFERLVWQRFGPSIRAGRWDVVHRVTPVSPVLASPIAHKVTRAGVPFVLGPLNGGVPWPAGFGPERRREGEVLAPLRGLSRADPSRRRTLNAASAIIAGSRSALAEVPHRHQAKTFVLPENAVDPGRFNLTARQDLDGPLRCCFVGRLVPLKGCDMLIEAAAPLLSTGAMTLDLVGDGPMRADLEEMVSRHGLEQSVRFHGQVPHRDVQDVLARAHLFTFLSIREFGGGSVLEAMALGVVPLVVDYAGPSELVTAQTGFRVPLGLRAEIVRSTRQRLTALAGDRSSLAAMGARSRARVEQLFTWTAKARHVDAVYEWVSGDRGPKPVLLDER